MLLVVLVVIPVIKEQNLVGRPAAPPQQEPDGVQSTAVAVVAVVATF
jgi:hypothetical protein